MPSTYDVADYIPTRLRAVYHAGHVVLVVAFRETATPEDQLFQFASNDLGMSFSLVSTLTGTSRAMPDLISHRGQIIMAYVSSPTGGSYAATYLPYIRRIGSAYESFGEADATILSTLTDTMEWGSQAGGVFTRGEMSLWADDDGSVYVMGRDHDTAGGAFEEVGVRVSTDDTVTWSDIGSGSAANDGANSVAIGDIATYPKGLCACVCQGRTIVAHTHEASPATGDDSLSVLWLGGYTNVEMAQYDANELLITRSTSWTRTWIPFDLPDNNGWTLTGTGTTRSLTGLGHRVVTGASPDQVFYTKTPTGTIAEGVTVLADVHLVSGNDVQVGAVVSDSTPINYEARVVATPTAISLQDINGSSTIASVSTTAAANGPIQIKITVESAKAKAWYRAVGANNSDAHQKWIAIGSTAALTSNASDPGMEVVWGQSEDTEAYWRMVCWVSDEYQGIGIYDQTNWSDLLGRGYNTEPVYVYGGTALQAVDGPTFRNDEWVITPSARYPVASVHPTVIGSPRRPWRSVDDSTQVDLEWVFGQATWGLGVLMGLYLGDVNFGTAELWGKNSGGTWVKIHDLSTKVATGLKFTRDGRVIRPDTSGGSSVPHYMPLNILAGHYFQMPRAQEGTSIKRVETNSSGAWVSGSATLDTRILLESIDGTEATSGTTGELWSNEYAAVFPITATYSAFRLRIPVQTTHEGYFRIGSMMLGEFEVLGREYSRGRSLEWASFYDLVDGRTGVRGVRQRGPTRRAVEVGWPDGAETTPISATNPDVDFVPGWTGGSSSSAVANEFSTPYDMGGMMERLKGAVTPCVYLAAVEPPPTNADIQEITNREIMLYGRIRTEAIRVDSVLGSEWAGASGELMRIGTARLEEEV